VYERFVMPALPALFIAAGVLLSGVWGWLSLRPGRLVFRTACLGFFGLLIVASWWHAVGLTLSHQKLLALDSRGKDFSGVVSAGRWIDKNIKDASIATNMGLYGTFYARRNTLYLTDYAFEPVDPANFRSQRPLMPQLKRQGVRVLLLVQGQNDPSSLYPDWDDVASLRDKKKRLVFESPGQPLSAPVSVIILGRR